MALYLRGNVWWMEYRTRKIRRQKSTGFHKEDKKKAQAVWDAWRLAFGARPRRSIVEELLDAVYKDSDVDRGGVIGLESVWEVYEDWMRGKNRVLTDRTIKKRKVLLKHFAAWAAKDGITSVEQVSVEVARRWVAQFAVGRANKTVRDTASHLLSIWNALSQMDGGIHNPWRAAVPDDDGSSRARLAFSEEEEKRVLDCAKKCGHDWYLASMVARWTGLRYGDVATLSWGDADSAVRDGGDFGVVDMKKRVVAVKPNKTKKHGVIVALPMAAQLYEVLSAVDESCRRGVLFPEHNHKYPLGLKGDDAFARVLEMAGLDTKRFSFHSWRHTFRTRLAQAGVSDETARKMGGWTNLKMSAHYDHASHFREMKEAMEKLEVRAER